MRIIRGDWQICFTFTKVCSFFTLFTSVIVIKPSSSLLHLSPWLLLLVLAACAPDEPENITPRADLLFTVVDDSGSPLPDARVYLFGTEAAYEANLADNPDGDPSVSPNLDLEDIATTNRSGVARFTDRPLDGPNSAVGESFLYQPRPIYFRTLAEQNGDFLTNDGGSTARHRLGFPELESGEVLLEEVEVIVR